MDVSTAKPHGELISQGWPRVWLRSSRNRHPRMQIERYVQLRTVDQKLRIREYRNKSPNPAHSFELKPLTSAPLDTEFLHAASQFPRRCVRILASAAPRMPRISADASRRQRPCDRWRAGISRLPYPFPGWLHCRRVERQDRELDTVSVHAGKTLLTHIQNLAREFIPFP